MFSDPLTAFEPSQLIAPFVRIDGIPIKNTYRDGEEGGTYFPRV